MGYMIFPTPGSLIASLIDGDFFRDKIIAGDSTLSPLSVCSVFECIDRDEYISTGISNVVVFYPEFYFVSILHSTLLSSFAS